MVARGVATGPLGAGTVVLLCVCVCVWALFPMCLYVCSCHKLRCQSGSPKGRFFLSATHAQRMGAFALLLRPRASLLYSMTHCSQTLVCCSELPESHLPPPPNQPGSGSRIPGNTQWRAQPGALRTQHAHTVRNIFLES